MSPILGDNDLNLGISGGGGLLWLLRDEFTTAAGAPLASPRTAEPGPGTWNVIDTTSKQSTSSGRLSWSGINANLDPSLAGRDLFARVGGRTLLSLLRYTGATGVPEVGFANAVVTTAANLVTARRAGLFLQNNTLNILLFTGSVVSIVVPGALTISTDYPCAVVARPTAGYAYFVELSSIWVLVWLDTLDNAANLAAFLGNAVNAACDANYARVRDLPAPFTTDNGIATLHDTGPVSATVYTGEANGISDLYFTLPAGSANLVAAELRYRRQDATNYWTAYIKRNAGNSAWDFLLDSVAAGTPTNRLTVGGVGTPDCLRVIHDGNLHDCYTKATTTWTKRGAQVSNAAFAANTGVAPVAGAGTTLTQLDVWARASGLYAELDKV